MTIAPLPAEKRNAIIQEIENLGRFPTVKEARSIGTKHGASSSTVRRIALKVAPPAPHQTQPAPAPQATPAPKAKAPLFQESVSPALGKPGKKPKPEPSEQEAEAEEDRDPRRCSDCGEEVQLEDGETWADVNRCPGCGAVFA